MKGPPKQGENSPKAVEDTHLLHLVMNLRSEINIRHLLLADTCHSLSPTHEPKVV